MGDSGREDIITYNDLVDAYLRTIAEQEENDGERLWIYKAITGHCKVGQRWEIKML